jgi:mannose-6-phosphate isomerase
VASLLQPYPLLFQAEMKERVWGGRALEQFGLTLPEGPIGEGWMIGDHPNGTTKVANGDLAGLGLDQLREQYGQAILGTKGSANKNGRFPLLIKLLDCQDELSVQVHPDDHYDRLPEGESGKTEMWYILDAKPGAKIIYGLNEGVTREQLAKAIEEKRILDCLREISVEAGDSFYIPSGTVHSLGAGILVAEIQQNSDSTYRLYDFDRLGLDGNPRELHIEDSLNVISFKGTSATYMKTGLSASNQWLTLANSPFFITEKGKVEQAWPLRTTSDSFVIHIVCKGSGSIQWADGELSLKPGDCMLLPANLGEYTLKGSMTVLRSYLP